MTTPFLALTPGEPAGIGPDLVIQLNNAGELNDVVVVADPTALEQRAELLGLELRWFDYGLYPQHSPSYGELRVLPLSCHEPVKAGQLSVENAQYVLRCLDVAVSGCLDGRFAALVTGPVHKGIINDAGIAFTGHTEYLAQLCKSDQVVMMLATEGLKVALATTHLPLHSVSQAISQELLTRVISVLHRDLMAHFGLNRPRVLVCGLNPHAGEGGHLGQEEIEVIEPVLNRLRKQGMELIGPVPADTAFVPTCLAQSDVVLTMYHDQGLPVLKHLGFGQAVNVTLGLPIIRTSVDHGTALDLAGTGRVDSGSLRTALNYARHMVKLSKAGGGHAQS